MRSARVTIVLLVVLLQGTIVRAEERAVSRNVHLRAQPSTASASLRVLTPPEEVDLTDPTPTSGFGHVMPIRNSRFAIPELLTTPHHKAHPVPLEPEAVVEAVRVLAPEIARELHLVAALLATERHRELHHRAAYAAAARRVVDHDVLDDA